VIHQLFLVSGLVVGLVAEFFHDEFLLVEGNSTLPPFSCDGQPDQSIRQIARNAIPL
jgi:hypothetical protein